MSVAQEQTVLDKIRTRGYWRVVIRPATFEENHITNYAELFPIVERKSVRLRGWDYPHVDYQSPPLRGAKWVGQEYECQDEIEVWRFYMSGQFIHFFAIDGEWRDRSTVWPAQPDGNPDVASTIFKRTFHSSKYLNSRPVSRSRPPGQLSCMSRSISRGFKGGGWYPRIVRSP